MAVGEAVNSVLKPLQAEVARLEKDKAYLDAAIKENAEKAQYYATKTLRKVQRKIGSGKENFTILKKRLLVSYMRKSRRFLYKWR